MNYYIKERHNGQSKPYFVLCGKMPAKEAKGMENTLAGFNIVHKFKTKREYEAKIAEIKASGESIV